MGPVVLGCLARQRRKRQVGLHRIAVQHEEAVLGDRLAHHGEVEVPLLEDRARRRLLLGAKDHQHPLLAFREHHLVGGHAALAQRDAIEVQADTQPTLIAHLDGRAGQARRAHVLDGDDCVGSHQLEAGLHQALFGEGVADLHRRTLFLDRRRTRPRPLSRRRRRRVPSWRRDRRSACRRRRRPSRRCRLRARFRQRRR